MKNKEVIILIAILAILILVAGGVLIYKVVLHKAKKAEYEAEQKAKETNLITIEELDKVELKVAKILTVERVEGANKLYKLTVDIGTEQRTVVSGLVPYYKEEELLGKKVVLVSNLKPAKLRGIESNGMLLAAGDDDVVKLLTIEGDIEPGTSIH